jgi:Tol biopolymer transport system component
MSRAVHVAAVTLGCFACSGDSPTVQCGQESDCNLSAGGLCSINEDTGHTWCTYADSACPAGRRWSEFGTGDGLAGQCVDTSDAGIPDAAPDAPPDAALIDAAPLPCSALVAFADGELDRHEVYVTRADGTAPLNISQSPDSDDVEPNWSPLRDRIVFSSKRRGNWDVFVAAANGEWQRNLTESSASDDRGAGWSPDGNRLAYERNGQLWTMNSDGSSPQPLVTSVRVSGSGGTIEWSPDGTGILFAGFPSNRPDIYVVDSSGATPPINLTNSRDYAENSARWSPDGSLVLYTNNLDVFVVKPDGTEARAVTSDAMSDSNPAWLPDGLSFVFTGLSGSVAKVYRQQLAGGSPVELSSGEGRGDRASDVSHDGALFAFVRETSDRAIREAGIANIDGSGPVFFSGGTRKVISPFFAPRCR